MTAFDEWKQKKRSRLQAEKDEMRRARKAKKKIKKPEPPPLSPPLVARIKLRLFSSFEADAAETVEDVAAGTRLRIVERRSDNGGGAERALIALETAVLSPNSVSASLGWVAPADKDGCPTLLEISAESCMPSMEVRKWMVGLDAERRATENAWLLALSPQRFRVLRMSGTEDANTGDLIDHFAEGTYVCAGCRAPIYTSQHKYKPNSECGWPAFCDNVDGALRRVPGRQVEILCRTCNGHVGHVFTGPFHPPPYQERHCANAASLRFVPAHTDPSSAPIAAPVSAPAPAPAAAVVPATGDQLQQLLVDDEMLSA